MTRKEEYEREIEKVKAANRSADEYRNHFGNERINWVLITDYEYDRQEGGDQRR